jgi:hypothetical protein
MAGLFEINIFSDLHEAVGMEDEINIFLEPQESNGMDQINIFTDSHESTHMEQHPVITPISHPSLPLPPKGGRKGASESAISFQAFKHYISLSAGERSLRRVAQDLHKSEKLMERWSSNFGWNERAKAWDRHVAAIEAEARETQLRQKAELWERRREEQREAYFQLHQLMLKKMTQTIQLPLIERIEAAAGKIITRPARSVMTSVRAGVRALIDLGREIFLQGPGNKNDIQEIEEFQVDSMFASMENAAP